MKKYLLMLSFLFLGACSTVRPNVHLPDASGFMKEPCVTELVGLPSNATKTDVLKATNENSKSFYLCSQKVNDWNKFYDELQVIVNK